MLDVGGYQRLAVWLLYGGGCGVSIGCSKVGVDCGEFREIVYWIVVVIIVRIVVFIRCAVLCCLSVMMRNVLLFLLVIFVINGVNVIFCLIGWGIIYIYIF